MARLVALFMLLAIAFAGGAPAEAVTLHTAECAKGGIRVKLGDTLWAYDGPRWSALKQDNPWLEADKRIIVLSQDDVRVAIYEGEFICGATSRDIKSGVVIQVQSYSSPPAAVGTAMPAPTPPAKVAPEPNWLAGLAVVLFIALIALGILVPRLWRFASTANVQAAAAVARAANAGTALEQARNELAAAQEAARAASAPRLDPANAGPAVVEGGVRDDQPELALRRMAEVAQATQAMIAPGRALVPVPVGALERGLLTGRQPQGTPVRYRDGSVVRGVLNREPGFRQTFRFTQPDGSAAELATYFLQRCGNDVIRTGGIPEEEIIFEPAATVAAAPASSEATAAAIQLPTLIELMEPQVLPAGEPVAVRTVPATVQIGLYPSGNGFVARIINIGVTHPKAGARAARGQARPDRSQTAGTERTGRSTELVTEL